MPLIPGAGKKTIRSNIGELMHAYHAKGHIGTSGPMGEEKAREVAAAIAYDKAREGRRRRVRPRQARRRR